MARATIAYLEQRYTALEKEIADALRQSPTDDLAIADLKYRKLIIADEIQQDRRRVERFDSRVSEQQELQLPRLAVAGNCSAICNPKFGSYYSTLT